MFNIVLVVGGALAWAGIVYAGRVKPDPHGPYKINADLGSGVGYVVKQPDFSGYNLNDHVMLTAVPHSGWRFIQWSGDWQNIAGELQNSQTSPTITLVMKSNRTLWAFFAVA